MSHTIYTTNAVILHRVPVGEAESVVWLLTEKLGLLTAHAQGARKEQAKMRAYLQTLGVTRVSLVRGKHVWRVTGAEMSTYDTREENRIVSGTVIQARARIASFVRKMIIANNGEDQKLFETVYTAWQEMHHNNYETWELWTMIRILVILGYIDTTVLARFEEGTLQKHECMTIIHNAIAESHL